MEELFGLSMTLIATVAVVLTAAIFAFLGLIALRNPVMFKNGLRNIPRRPTQTALIVVGLMLATVIMTAAFSTGDTVARSVTDEVYRISGETDEIIAWNSDDFPRPQDQQVIPLDVIDRLREEFRNDPDIDGFLPGLVESLPVLNRTTRLNEASATIVAYATKDAGPFGDLRDTEGNVVQLAGNQIAINKDLADEIDGGVGDRLLLFFEGRPVEAEVVAIAPNSFLSGAFGRDPDGGAGGAVSFQFLSSVLGRENTADVVLVTNVGGIRSGVGRTDAAVDKLELALRGAPYEVDPFKQDMLEIAQLAGSIFTTVFVAFGLFSISAGILLIFLIFVMLAAERKPEMGIARAVGAKRRHLVESFLAEGMGYDLGAALIGVGAGIGVTFAMVRLVNSFAEEGLGLNLQVHLTARGLLVAFCLGVISTFIVITVAAVRASRLNITAAIRDLPETKPSNIEAATVLGYVRGALNAFVAAGYLVVGLLASLRFPAAAAPLLVAVLTGLVGPWLYLLRGHSFGAPADDRVRGERLPLWPFIILPMIPFYLVALLIVRLTRNRRPQKAPLWLIVVSLAIPPLALVLAALQDRGRPTAWGVGFAMVGAVIAALFIEWTFDSDQFFFFAAGVSLLLFWVASTLRYFGAAERPTFSITAAVLLLFWYSAPAGAFEWLTSELNSDIEMFFLSGIVTVAAGTLLLVYNADLLLPAVGALGARVGPIVPAMKTAVAYPLTARFRTGMTIAMIGLVMFSLIVNATLNENFARVFLSDDAKGGFDVETFVNGNNRVDDLLTEMKERGVDTSKVRAAAEMRMALPFETEIADGDVAGPDRFARYTVFGASGAFFRGTKIEMKHRAAGFESDGAVWAALAADPTLAVIDANLTAGHEGFGDVEDLLELDRDLDDGFEPFTLDLRDPGSQRLTTVTVIGQMADSADIFWPGIIVQRDTLLSAFPDSQAQVFFLALDEGVDSIDFARSIESGLVQASAESLDKLLDDQRRAQTGFLLLFQGFMGLGLVVGIAALGVVSFRSVVERRQQIGVLRAIGYQRSMVALSFLFESGFVALSGIILGAVLGLSFSWVIFTSGTVGEASEGADFSIPWLQVIIVCGIALAASVLMTLLPARSASMVAVAEALRYE